MEVFTERVPMTTIYFEMHHGRMDGQVGWYMVRQV